MHKYGNVMITYGCHLHHGMTLPPPLYFGLQDLYASIMPRGHEDQGRHETDKEAGASALLYQSTKAKSYHEEGLDKYRFAEEEALSEAHMTLKQFAFTGKAHKERSITALITLWSAAQD